jgi:hypothetical protein
MQNYTFNFQIGDIVLFKKVMPIAHVTHGNVVGEPVLNITDLAAQSSQLPHYFMRVVLADQQPQPPLTISDGKLFYVRTTYPNYYLKLDNFTTFDDYMGKFSGKTRSTLLRKFRQALQHGFQYKIYTTVAEVDEFHQLACAVGEKTYQYKLFNSSIPANAAYRDKIKQLAEQGNFLGLMLFYDNEPCAYLYCPIVDGHYVYAYLGYLKKYAEHSPGTVLQLAMLMHVYANPLKAVIFDFTEGDGKHKDMFATDKAWCCNCLVLENTLSNRFIVRQHMRVDAFSKLLGNFLDKYNLREKIKKLIRRAAS